MSGRARAVVEARASRGLGGRLAAARRDARAVLSVLELGPCELSVALVDDEEMRALNRDWRGKDRPTDVLAFPQADPGEPSPAGLLGDVVVSVPTAERQAAARGHSAEEEIRTLLVHGILHLLGYDHERGPADARRMFRRQREVLASLVEPRAPRRVAKRPSKR
ncbi:MAG: rRNA maturation RNase YbeY [Alphaproteobacteria bacterium]